MPNVEESWPAIVPVIGAQPVIDVEDVVVVLVVVPVVMSGLARLRKHTPRIVR